ncbi:spore coat polysaccharide biosynthesis protein SpsK family protein [Leptospira borgpetersenii serovar Pomona str. 200901868]|uniref:dTDP-4-dehydrorhamnose reductase n=1 Tax=Leptospira borgpetersenii serovar Pomona str. 200901868 TaxID=1192866 RepID=M6W1M3_LEPBO|nr:spore coat polysaccharide biosynthesis protein SpsK family protein [Leptospira borgpetersenii serovar Pomona str. 200901868]
MFDANSETIGDTIRFWKPDSTLSPKGIYGLSKAEGEKWIQDIFADSKQANIVRTSWVYSSYGNNFPKTILKLLQDPKHTELKVIEDQLGRPTWAGRLADFIIFLIYEILKGGGIRRFCIFPIPELRVGMILRLQFEISRILFH